ncbi:MAG: DUF456 domain-containing protein [Bacteroidales bacterium]|jgi:uncharacterized protein YqgC (DUF456 family)|nr:DUF456 domain-containing protein [Bacteroidales bacterium]
MDIFLIILGFILLIVGFLGCILPIIPGVPLCYAAILLLHFTTKVNFSVEFLVGWGVVVIAMQIIDYFIPIWGTKKFGGSRLGTIGSFVGVVIGLFFGLLGIIIGPFIGAVAGELIAGKESRQAFKAGFGSFVGFLIGTIGKLVVSSILIYYYILFLFDTFAKS